MRNNFADELLKIAHENPKVILLSGDIGNRIFDGFQKAFPERFYNCGVAEANMNSAAAGLAMCGFLPITYTITPFNTTRCLEQIRNDICYHNVPVIIVGVGAGLSYSSLGGSHHACEDISFLRTIPNMRVLCPADSFELRALMKEAFKNPQPTYLRIGKKGESNVYSKLPDITIGKASLIKEGSKICLIGCGNIMPIIMKTADLLEKDNQSTAVYSMHTVKPLDKETLKTIFSNFKMIVSIEEHSSIGGLSSAIAEFMVDERLPFTNYLRFTTEDRFPSVLGSHEFLRDSFGLSDEKIYKTISSKLKG